MKKVIFLSLLIFSVYFISKKYCPYFEKRLKKNKIEKISQDSSVCSEQQGENICSQSEIEKIEEGDQVQSIPMYLINVLGEAEYDDAHIPGSINIPYDRISSFLETVENKDSHLIFYCSNYFCTASDDAAKKAVKKGFKNAFVYKGGMAEWYQASLSDTGFSVHGPAKNSYLQFVVVPEKEILDKDVDIIDEDDVKSTDKVTILSINDLQKILKEGKLKS